MGPFTKSINKISVINNIIEYEKVTNVNNKDFTEGVNLFNGSVFGFYNLFSRPTITAFCNDFSFCFNTIRNPLTTIIRLTPFNEVGKFAFNGNTITNCWTCTQGALINAGVISVYPACYEGDENVRWGDFIISDNNINFDYDEYELAFVFIGLSDKTNVSDSSSLLVLNNIVKAPVSKLVKIKEGFFRNTNFKSVY